MNHELPAFLSEVKQQTYDNQNAKKLNPSREGSVDYEYSLGQILYHDTYFGGTRFIGEEVVYINEQTYTNRTSVLITRDKKAFCVSATE